MQSKKYSLALTTGNTDSIYAMMTMKNKRISTHTYNNTASNSSRKEKPKIINETLLNSLIKENTLTNRKDPQIAYEYLSDIFESLHQEEMSMKINPQYMEKQKDINEKMRAVIVDWIIEVHYRFKLYPETLFLCVGLMDKYLSVKSISRIKLQLISVACLLIACKYEEIFSPEIRDFVCIMDKSWEKEDIITMEKEILKSVKFDVTLPSRLRFFEILAVACNFNTQECYYARYLLELTLVSNKCNSYMNSLVSCAVCLIVIKIFKSDKDNSICVKNVTRLYNLVSYKESEIKECVLEICFLLENVEESSYQAIRKKFQTKQFMEVANIKIF
jgi:hypothetical protein